MHKCNSLCHLHLIVFVNTSLVLLAFKANSFRIKFVSTKMPVAYLLIDYLKKTQAVTTLFFFNVPLWSFLMEHLEKYNWDTV